MDESEWRRRCVVGKSEMISGLHGGLRSRLAARRRDEALWRSRKAYGVARVVAARRRRSVALRFRSDL
jgi:hypothetical protein